MGNTLRRFTQSSSDTEVHRNSSSDARRNSTSNSSRMPSFLSQNPAPPVVKFAPRNPVAGDDTAFPECPICFLNYEALNVVSCCREAICTDCYGQLKKTPKVEIACPFCSSHYFSASYEEKPKSSMGNSSSPPPVGTLILATNSGSTSQKPQTISVPHVPLASVQDRLELEREIEKQRIASQRQLSRSNSMYSSSSVPSASGSWSGAGRGIIRSRTQSERVGGTNTPRGRNRLGLLDDSGSDDGMDMGGSMDALTSIILNSRAARNGALPSRAADMSQLEEIMLNEAIRLSMLETQNSTSTHLPPPPPSTVPPTSQSSHSPIAKRPAHVSQSTSFTAATAIGSPGRRCVSATVGGSIASSREEDRDSTVSRFPRQATSAAAIDAPRVPASLCTAPSLKTVALSSGLVDDPSKPRRIAEHDTYLSDNDDDDDEVDDEVEDEEDIMMAIALSMGDDILSTQTHSSSTMGSGGRGGRGFDYAVGDGAVSTSAASGRSGISSPPRVARTTTALSRSQSAESLKGVAMEGRSGGDSGGGGREKGEGACVSRSRGSSSGSGLSVDSSPQQSSSASLLEKIDMALSTPPGSIRVGKTQGDKGKVAAEEETWGDFACCSSLSQSVPSSSSISSAAAVLVPVIASPTSSEMLLPCEALAHAPASTPKDAIVESPTFSTSSLALKSGVESTGGSNSAGGSDGDGVHTDAVDQGRT